MFDNAGAKIKGLAIILFCFMIVVSAILGIILMVSSNSGGGIMLGLGVIFGGGLIGLIGGLMVYAYGEIAEKVSAQADDISMILSLMKKDNSKMVSTETVVDHSVNVIDEKNGKDAKPWRCSQCGTINKAGRISCSYCKYVRP